MITINPQAADVITIQLSDADQIQLNTAAIVIASDGDADTLQGEDGAYYLDRDNHTGTQAANTITGLAVVATSGSYNDLSDKPTISTNAETLDGQDGAYYLSRVNHTGAQAISTVTGLQAALDDKLESVAWGDITGTLSDQTDLQDAFDLKLNIADYNDRFLGLFSSVFDLVAAHPTASAGDYAQVDSGIGTDVIVYAWDVSDAQWSAVGSSALNISLDPASLSDAGAILPTDQLVIYRNGVPLRTTVAQLGLAPTPPKSLDLLLVPTGATESADGVFQRFVPNATDPLGYPAYYAELAVADWQGSPISVQFKWPDLTVVYDALVIFFSSGNYDSIENPVGDATDSIYAALQIARTSGSGQGEPYNFGVFDFYKFGVEPPTSEPLTLTPSAGDIATLDFTRTQMTLTVGGETQTYAIPVGIFTGAPLLNVVAKVESAVLPLSIKVSLTE